MKITVSIASLYDWERKNFVREQVKRLLAQTIRPDKVIVYLDGYKRVPNNFIKDEDVKYILYPKVSSAAISFGAVDLYKSDYFFSLDDDLEIPIDYIEKCIEEMKVLGPQAAISFLGRKWKEGEMVHYRNCEYTHFEAEVKERKELEVMGSGVAAFRSNQVKGCVGFLLSGLLDPLYRDQLISFYLYRKKIKIYRPASPSKWIKVIRCSVTCDQQKPPDTRNENLERLMELGFMR